MTEIHSPWPLDWDVADTEPWYKSGSVELDGETRWVEAIFRNDRKRQVVVQVLPMRISLGGLLVRHVIPTDEFQPDEHKPDELMVALMRHLMGKD